MSVSIKFVRLKVANSLFTTLLTVIAMLLASELHAEGFRNPPPGAAGLGRAGVYIAHVDDASAVSYNPANLARISGDSIMAAVSIGETDADYDSFLLGSASSDSSMQFLPNVYASWALGDDRAFAIGVTTPFGQSSEWDKDSVIRYVSPYFVEMQLANINPSYAAKVSENVYFGAGFDIYVSSLEFKQLADNGPLPGDGNIDLEAEGMGIGGNVGLSWDMADAQTLALTYRTSVRVDYEGDARIRNLPVPLPSRVDLDSEINFPAILGLGYGIQCSETLRLELDVEWLEYSVNDSIPLDAPAYNAMVLPGEIQNDWDDSWTVGLGGDWQFTESWTLYAGYAFLESPIPDETYSPSLPDSDRHVFSLGLGFEKNGHALAVSYAASMYDDRDIDNNQNPALNAEYEIESYLLGLSYSCQL